MNADQVAAKALVSACGMNAQARYRRTHIGLWKTGMPRVRPQRRLYEPVDTQEMLEDDYADPFLRRKAVRDG